MLSPTNNIQQLLHLARNFCQQGQLLDARRIYNELINKIPSNTELLTNLGTIELQLGNYEVAEKLLKKSIKITPNQPNVFANLGNRYLDIGLFETAISFYSKAIQLEPNYLNAYFNKGKAYVGLKTFDKAVEIFKKCIQLEPMFIDAHINIGASLNKLERYAEALVCYEQVLALNVKSPEIYFNRGFALEGLRKFNEALSSYNSAILLDPAYIDAHLAKGATHLALKNFHEAMASYAKVIELKPDCAEAYLGIGVLQVATQHFDEAMASYAKAIELKPDYTEAYSNSGLINFLLKHFDEAMANYAKAIELKPDHAESFLGIGAVHFAMKRYDEAMANYAKAIELKPDYAEAYSCLGSLFQNVKRYEDALANYERAFQLKPDINYLLGNLIHTRMYLCEWNNFDRDLDLLLDNIEHHQKVALPFATLALTDRPAIQKVATRVYIDDIYPAKNELPCLKKYSKHKKIRVGYYSADFREHPVSYLTAELFELHNRERFEVMAFSFGDDTQDPMRKRLEGAFDRFEDVKTLTDQQIVQLSRDMEIDIAVDLGGLTGGCRTNIFAMRAAPIQLSYIGYLGTMAADYFDYLVADRQIIPESQKQHYSEKIIYLPCYQVNDTKLEYSKKIFSRKEIGLPENAFVFCCFNNIFKITPHTFDGWMRILNAVDGSVLLLYGVSETVKRNIEKEAEVRGVSPERMVFGEHMPMPEYLARYRVADLFLDTFPYNAGTTASDALRMGLPLITRAGDSFASRVASSLLSALGLSELVTHTQHEYEQLAIGLAKDSDKLKYIKSKLVKNLKTSNLYDSNGFVKNIEHAYKEIYSRYHDQEETMDVYIG